MTDYEVAPPPDRIADRVQLRTAFSTDRGEVTRFIVEAHFDRVRATLEDALDPETADE